MQALAPTGVHSGDQRHLGSHIPCLVLELPADAVIRHVVLLFCMAVVTPLADQAGQILRPPAGGVTPAHIASSSSVKGGIDTAWAVSRICCACFAPGMTVVTSGCARHYWIAARASGVPGGTSAATCPTSLARRAITAGDQRRHTSLKRLSPGTCH